MGLLSRRSGWLFGLLLAGLLGVPRLKAAEAPSAAAPPSQEQVTQWIAQLGAPEFVRREEAQAELAKLGFGAFEALTAASKAEDLEIAARARYLLGRMRMHWSEASDPPEIQKLLRDYEFLDPGKRVECMRELAFLHSEVGFLALGRLVRYEASELLSKYAAIELLDRPPLDPQLQTRLAQRLRTQLEPSSRPAAQWVLADEELQKDSVAAEAAWLQHVEAEQGRAPDAAGPAQAEVAVSLLYHLAEMQAQQGHAAQAEATAARARQLNPGAQATQLRYHFRAAWKLQHRGHFAWADEEYRLVIQDNALLGYQAEVIRAEMWHDQGRYAEAAQALEHAAALLEQTVRGQPNVEQKLDQLRARVNYFQACHWRTQGDEAQQRQHLEQALALDPKEVDSLIAAWKLQEAPPEFRAKIRLLLQRATSELRREASNSEDANGYNLFAWLVGNTQGDLKEALRYSQKSVELEPNNGAYHDTLAHVYFAQGDWDNAVKSQTRASELEPHSGLIAQELQRFRAEQERQRGTPAAGSQ